MLVKIAKFIKKQCNKAILLIQKPINSLKTVHQTLMQQDGNGNIPYFLAYQWIIEILYYGFLLAIVYVDLFIINGWLKWALFPFSLGAIRWLWLDFVENTVNAIKGKT